MFIIFCKKVKKIFKAYNETKIAPETDNEIPISGNHLNVLWKNTDFDSLKKPKKNGKIIAALKPLKKPSKAASIV